MKIRSNTPWDSLRGYWGNSTIYHSFAHLLGPSLLKQHFWWVNTSQSCQMHKGTSVMRIRDKHIFIAPKDVCKYLFFGSSILLQTLMTTPCPLLIQNNLVPLSATLIYTDASGHIAAHLPPHHPSPSSSSNPEEGMLQTGALSLPFPTNFLPQSQ